MMTLKTCDWRRGMTGCALVGGLVFVMVQGPSRAQDRETNSATGSETVEVCGLHVVGTCDPSSPGRSKGCGLGTTVSLLVRANGAQFLRFDEDASKISVFADDKGKDLIDRYPGRDDRIFRTFGANVINGQGQTANIDVNVRHLPTSGAGKLHVKGTLVFKKAGQLQTVRGTMNLKSGGQAKIGPITLRITSVELVCIGDPHLGSTHHTIQFEYEGQDPDTIKTFQLLDHAGAVISQSAGGGFRRNYQIVTGNRGLFVPKEVQSGTIEIAYWNDSTVVEVPVNVTVSAGL